MACAPPERTFYLPSEKLCVNFAELRVPLLSVSSQLDLPSIAPYIPQKHGVRFSHQNVEVP